MIKSDHANRNTQQSEVQLLNFSVQTFQGLVCKSSICVSQMNKTKNMMLVPML